MEYYVSRQMYWGVDPDESNTVEIAQGGLNYANPDMLVSRYSGEGQEYTNPVEAVEAAIEIAKAWKKDCPKLKINIASGYTGGCTMPFEASTTKKLRAWAKKLYKTLKKCDHCKDLIDGVGYKLTECPYDVVFCSEYCADKYLIHMDASSLQP